MVGEDHPPVFIAEMSGNHGGSLNTALELVDAMAKAGAQGLKLQTYTADTMTLNCDGPGFVIEEANSLWKGERLYDLYEKAHTPWEWHEPLFQRAADLGLDFFSTPFDETAVDFLESLGVSRYKIASIEIVDIPLIKKVAETGKPLVLSTGASTMEEVAEAVGVPRQTIDDWTKDFAEMSKSDISAFPSGFEPPIYNVWKQQTKTNAVADADSKLELKFQFNIQRLRTGKLNVQSTEHLTSSANVLAPLPVTLLGPDRL
jgi:sialic acid synthase SpsE